MISTNYNITAASVDVTSDSYRQCTPYIPTDCSYNTTPISSCSIIKECGFNAADELSMRVSIYLGPHFLLIPPSTRPCDLIVGLNATSSLCMIIHSFDHGIGWVYLKSAYNIEEFGSQ